MPKVTSRDVMRRFNQDANKAKIRPELLDLTFDDDIKALMLNNIQGLPLTELITENTTNLVSVLSCLAAERANGLAIFQYKEGVSKQTYALDMEREGDMEQILSEVVWATEGQLLRNKKLAEEDAQVFEQASDQSSCSGQPKVFGLTDTPDPGDNLELMNTHDIVETLYTRLLAQAKAISANEIGGRF